MGMLGKGSGIVIGIIILITGILLQGNLIEWLLDVMGFILVVVGIVVIVVSLIGMVAGGKSKSRGY